MRTKKYKYVQSFTDRHGTVRHYFRQGKLRIPLPGAPGSLAFLKVYEAALNNTKLPGKIVKPAKKLAENLVNGRTPKMGVYLLMLDDRVVYVGTSLNMSGRVADHRQNGRPFDRVFYIGTSLTERHALEKILIRAIQPAQNRAGTDREPQKATRVIKVANS
jgi:hypothetical protein